MKIIGATTGVSVIPIPGQAIREIDPLLSWKRRPAPASATREAARQPGTGEAVTAAA